MNHFKLVCSIILCLIFNKQILCQQNNTLNSAEIFLKIKKLQVLGSILYIAAHPDDENNGLLPFLAKERLYRTGYLSLTRGDGGQNLIGQEQGIELGLIRTQELLAARKIDGCEQFFTRAYEFGFSKSSKETLEIWDKEKILSDIVWVIRNYQPDIIITRFPEDQRAGHGHHAASAILANQAFLLAADPTAFPEQFNFNIKPWKTQTIFWNSYNFTGNKVKPDSNEVKLNIGVFNTLLGKSYGEIGAEARTMHKSQGEGRYKRRGDLIEFFQFTNGQPIKEDLMENINTHWNRIDSDNKIEPFIQKIKNNFNFENPANSLQDLITLFKMIQALENNTWKEIKLKELKEIIELCAGLFLETSTNQEYVVNEDTVQFQIIVNNRSNMPIQLRNIKFENLDSQFNNVILKNKMLDISKKIIIKNKAISQPYWLENAIKQGIFEVNDQQKIGLAENLPIFNVKYILNIFGQDFEFLKPALYKYLDPVKGELFQPIVVLPKYEIKFEKDNIISINKNPISINYNGFSNQKNALNYNTNLQEIKNWKILKKECTVFDSNYFQSKCFNAIKFQGENKDVSQFITSTIVDKDNKIYNQYKKSIQYDHIPHLTYFNYSKSNLINLHIQIVGKKIGYIVGAGDKVFQGLQDMGYDVTIINEENFNTNFLSQFDAIVIGIRAHNIHYYLTKNNAILNNYIANGGNVLMQYIKSNQIGINNIEAGPFPFKINAGARVTDENAAVHFILPNHPALNFPNKISPIDFENWVQERSTYQIENISTNFITPLEMNDPNEKPSKGSLVIMPYKKGNFVYISVSLFRQIPAGNFGAYKLLANLIALPKGVD